MGTQEGFKTLKIGVRHLCMVQHDKNFIGIKIEDLTQPNNSVPLELKYQEVLETGKNFTIGLWDFRGGRVTQMPSYPLHRSIHITHL